MPLTKELAQQIATAPSKEAKVLVISLLQGLFSEYDQRLSKAESAQELSNIQTINLSDCALHRLDIIDLIEIARVCIGRFSVQLLSANSLGNTDNNINQEFQKLTYEQQQEFALLVLRAKWQNKIFVQYQLLIEYSNGKANVEGIAFNLNEYPTAYFELLKNYISHLTDRYYAMCMLKHIYLKLFAQFESAILSKQQLAWLILYAHSETKQDKMFNVGKASIKNICDFCLEDRDKEIFFAVSIAIINLYQFKNTQEKITFLNNLNQIKTENISYEWEFMLITEQMPIVSFAEVKELTLWLKKNNFISSFSRNNTIVLTAEQRVELIDLALSCDQLSQSILLYMTKEEILKVCKIPNVKIEIFSLTHILKKKGFTNQEILSVMQDSFKNVAFDPRTLDLSINDVKEYLLNNPGAGFTLDLWVQEQTGLSSVEFEDLLIFRLLNSTTAPNRYDAAHYKIANTRKISDFLLANPRIDGAGVATILDWDDQYPYLINNFNESPKEIFYIEDFNPPKHLKDLISTQNVDPSDYGFENINDVIGESDQPYEIDESNVLTMMMDARCYIFASIIGAKSTYKMDLMRSLYSNWSTDNQTDLDKYALIIGLKVRLLQEVNYENLRIAFAQTEFVNIIADVINIAIPHIRTGLIDKIVRIAKDSEKLAAFADLFKKANKHSRIPLLILIASFSEKSTIVKMLNMIGKPYHDKQNLKILIDALLSLAQANLTDTQKISLYTKIMTFDLQFALAKPERDQLRYNNLFIVSNIVGTGVKFGIYALDVAGDIFDVPDLSAQPKLKDVNTLLNKLHSRGKKFTRNSEEILAAIRKTGLFACGKEFQLQGLLMLQSLVTLNKINMIFSDKLENRPWFALFAAAMQEEFEVAISEEKIKHLMLTLSAARNPFAIIAYYAKLNTLPEKQYIEMLRKFMLMIASPDAADFYSYRYDLQQQQQLKAVLGNEPAQLSIWKQDACFYYDLVADVAKNLLVTTAPESFDTNNFLSRQILQFKHLDPKDFALLHAFLSTEDVMARDTIRTTAKDLYKKSQGWSTKTLIAEFQCEIIEFFASIPTLNPKQQLKKILKLIGSARASSELESISADLVLVTTYLKKKLQPETKISNTLTIDQWSIVNTDDKEDLLLVGTEVHGSCQNVYGSPSLNKCLIGGYVLAGYNRIVAIKNENNQIIARSILRLMLDTTSNQPILFLEDVYPQMCDVKQKQILIFLAAWCAWQMSCNLVTSMQVPGFNSINYRGQLKVVAVHSAEYVDALTCYQETAYTINNSLMLFNYAATRNKVTKEIFDTGRALGNPAFGPQPMTKLDDLVFMYKNYTHDNPAKKAEFNKIIAHSAMQVYRRS